MPKKINFHYHYHFEKPKMKNNDKFEQMKQAHELKYPLACQKLNFSPQNTMHRNAQRSVNNGQFPCPLIAEIFL